ncbi:CoA-binding protein [Clostridium nigeriense]|uniref:CoA-binding protein n=1 Tax=Clostridium nigeriense TaxID=1805470 RepID=UPI000830AA07|nr:CoA-binding protein [Clostridium nigeriense]
MDIKELIMKNNWVVIGDVNNKEKYAYKILEKFKDKGYTVAGVHPKGGEGVYKSLKEVPYKINAIDLCINSKLGIEYLKEARELEIKNILIQPGAESEEILVYCKENKINAIENCALVQLRNI